MKVGDKVRVLTIASSFAKMVGVISKIEDTNIFPIEVVFAPGEKGTYFNSLELEVIV
jgi:hypothetical protein